MDTEHRKEMYNFRETLDYKIGYSEGYRRGLDYAAECRREYSFRNRLKRRACALLDRFSTSHTNKS